MMFPLIIDTKSDILFCSSEHSQYIKYHPSSLITLKAQTAAFIEVNEKNGRALFRPRLYKWFLDNVSNGCYRFHSASLTNSERASSFS